MEQKNEINLERKNDVALMHIQGDITAQSEPYINHAYKELNEPNGVSKILIRFDETAYINSGGIAVLIQILAHAQKHDQKIGITGLSDHFKKIFRMVGITKFAEIYDGPDAAIQAMSVNSSS
jgi:anti-anti-sigma factor